MSVSIVRYVPMKALVCQKFLHAWSVWSTVWTKLSLHRGALYEEKKFGGLCTLETEDYLMSLKRAQLL